MNPLDGQAIGSPLSTPLVQIAMRQVRPLGGPRPRGQEQPCRSPFTYICRQITPRIVRTCAGECLTALTPPCSWYPLRGSSMVLYTSS